jgi:GNAT superfamily N-acetyltransferase
VDLQDLLRATLDFERTWVETGCAVEQRPWGSIFRNERYPLVHMANFAWVNHMPLGGPEEVLEALDRAFRGTTVPHRCLLFEEAQEAFQNQEALTRIGFRPDADLAMARLGIPSCITNPDLALREVGKDAPEEHYRRIRLAIQDDLGWSEEESRQVYALDRERAGSVGWRSFVSYLGDEPAGTVALWPRKTFAVIEDVATLPRFRMKGVGRTMIFEACKRAVDLGCEWTLLTTPLMGSPKIMYTTLGFQPVGEIRVFLNVKRPEAAR